MEFFLFVDYLRATIAIGFIRFEMKFILTQVNTYYTEIVG